MATATATAPSRYGRHNPDVHPEDLAARATVRDQLYRLRRDRGYVLDTFPAVCGLGRAAVWRFERDAQANAWLGSATKYAAGLGYDYTLVPDGIRRFADPDPTTARMLDTLGPDYRHAALQIRLEAARVAAGISCVEAGRRIGVASGWVNQVERHDPDLTCVSTFQRVARALGGRLVPTLVPIGGGE